VAGQVASSHRKTRNFRRSSQYSGAHFLTRMITVQIRNCTFSKIKYETTSNLSQFATAFFTFIQSSYHVRNFHTTDCEK